MHLIRGRGSTGGEDRSPARRSGVVVAGLAVTETVSWGILYYGFAVLIPAMERDLGWSRATLVGAFTLAVIVSGIGAFPVGRWLDRGSPRLLMTSGSVLAVLGVLGWSQSRTVVGFYGVWLLLGVAMALVLYEPAQVVLVKQCGNRATQAITAMTLVAGFASTIFQPTIAMLQEDLGWRDALIVLAVGMGVVTIAVHALVVPGRPAGIPPVTLRRRSAAAQIAPTVRDPAMAGLTASFTLATGAMSAAIVHLIPYLTDRGWSDIRAASAAALIGITQVAARVVFALLAEGVSSARLSLGVLLIPVGGMIVLALSGGNRAAWVAVALLGIGQGTATLLRPLLLSQRLDSATYGRGAARSAAWSTVARAAAPLGLALLAGVSGVGYAGGLALAAAVGALGAVIAARSLAVPPPPRDQPMVVGITAGD